MQEGQLKTGQCRKAEWITGSSAHLRHGQGGRGSHSLEFEECYQTGLATEEVLGGEKKKINNLWQRTSPNIL